MLSDGGIFRSYSPTAAALRKKCIILVARAHADQLAPQARRGHVVHCVGNDAVPEADPQWNYHANSIDRDRWDHMINCLIEATKKLTLKPVNYEKLREVQQRQDENPAVFQGRLVEALEVYKHGSLLPQETGPFGYSFHSSVCPRPQAQTSESHCWSSDSKE